MRHNIHFVYLLTFLIIKRSKFQFLFLPYQFITYCIKIKNYYQIYQITFANPYKKLTTLLLNINYIRDYIRDSPLTGAYFRSVSKKVSQGVDVS